MQHHQLSDSQTCLHVQGIFSAISSPSPSIHPKDTSNPYLTLLSEFPSLTRVCSPLGIRTAFKVDISSTSAELVYGTTLRLPGEFFDSSSVSCSPDPTDFVSQLKFHFQSIRPQPPRPTSHSSHITDGLATATHVFVHCGQMQ